jgi:hypothetical protein
MDSDLLQYVRKGSQRVRAGVLLARKVKKNKKVKVLVGWSKCKLTVDKFDPVRGKEIAEGRIQRRLEGDKGKGKVPHSIKDKVKEFVERAKRYYKTENVKVV